jgi:very-short-patch-repair endonuclease
MQNNIFYNKDQKVIRRKLRQSDIACENIIWQKLRNSQTGYKFRRQVGIEKYIADFYCYELKLVIEIDGATHGTPEELANDKIRDEFFKDQGLIVKRYLNTDVKENLQEVLYDLQQVCEGIKNLNSKISTSP